MRRKIIFDNIENSELNPNTTIKANEQSGSIYAKSKVYSARDVARLINSGRYNVILELIERTGGGKDED